MLNNSIKYLEKAFDDAPLMIEPAAVNIESTFDDAESLRATGQEISDIDNLRFQGLIKKQGRVDRLIWAFRDVGYIYAGVNPLGDDYQEHYTNLPLARSAIYEKLSPDEFGLSEDDLDDMFYGGPAFNNEKKPLREIIDTYTMIYCSSTGFEYLHIQNKVIRKWFIAQCETQRNSVMPSVDEIRIIMDDLVTAEEFEQFLQKSYIGQKRFSIEGAETIIPCLHYLVNNSLKSDVRDIVIGTTHRGRLTILNRILQLPLEDVFSLFEDNYDPEMVDGGGDVKYHIGYTREHAHDDGTSIRITLPPNASHLESVGPIVQGRARGIQDSIDDSEKKHVIPVILHGEAAFAGQGVVSEVLNLSQLKGYTTGGSIHIIINNQVGFTTSTRDEHSSVYSSDLAKSMAAPILHVNGDDPIAAVRAMKLAIDYRKTFGKDIVVDILCYRKYGHNEGDDPSFTHPRMYSIISKHKSVAGIFGDFCIQNGFLAKEELDAMRTGFVRQLKDAYDTIHQKKNIKDHALFSPHTIKKFDHDLMIKSDVGLEESVIRSIAEYIHKVPDGFSIHEKLKSILTARYNKFLSDGIVDWAFAESIAFGSLLIDGYRIRMSGQDSERGTFSQRHLVWWDKNTDEPASYIPLNHLDGTQTEISVYDSPLSEYSVLGFDFGYSISCPKSLVMWEAQFGDFSNGAQVIIDNYIIASEAKWNIRSGIVLLLPHGYEGQGPEHSNAHMDRYLQLCAQENIQVCNVTTPAQYFCLLRRQVVLNVEKPLILMTPKSLLRHPMAVSTISELAAGHFQFVIDDHIPTDQKITKLIFCCGKVYYDLLKKRDESKIYDSAIIRIEQLYPFPQREVEKVLTKYKDAKDRRWVQEEPQNRGAWTFVKYQFEFLFGEHLKYVGRNPCASPATGSLALFKIEQEKIMNNAFG